VCVRKKLLEQQKHKNNAFLSLSRTSKPEKASYRSGEFRKLNSSEIINNNYNLIPRQNL
jgi:hypothetical protein